jgi:hypothetical protein
VTGIPGVINMANIGLVDGIFWVPQVVGGCGFIISRCHVNIIPLTIVYYFCSRHNQIGIIYVHLTPLVGMLDFGILSELLVLLYAVHLGLQMLNHGLNIKVDVLLSGEDGLS